MRFDPSRRALILAAAASAVSAPALAFRRRSDEARFPNIDYAAWTDAEPQYRFYPGDQIEIALPSAPELDRTVVVAPDGRISMPLVGSVMAADRTLEELGSALTQAYRDQLARPEAQVSLKQAAPMRVLVGGEVITPGWVEMGGDLDALQAVFAAGGAKPSAALGAVVVIRRAPGGRPMRRVVNLARALRDPGRSDLVPLRRYDIVFVPRSSLSEAGVFMTQVRDLIPFSFSYSLNNPYGR
jgi:polysaccharide export outer membrane protein